MEPDPTRRMPELLRALYSAWGIRMPSRGSMTGMTGRAFQFIRRVLGAAHADAADDLHQEAWISVSRNAASYDPGKASFAAWLYTIARNRVWDHFRRQKVAVLAAVEDDMTMRNLDRSAFAPGAGAVA